MKQLVLSPLPKTWLFDIDGVIFKHNGYLTAGEDILLDNVQDFFSQIDKNDLIILLTSRTQKYKAITLKALRKYKIRYNHIVFDLPMGERILINDSKPSGLVMAKCIATQRDKMDKIQIKIDESL